MAPRYSYLDAAGDDPVIRALAGGIDFMVGDDGINYAGAQADRSPWAAAGDDDAGDDDAGDDDAGDDDAGADSPLQRVINLGRGRRGAPAPRGRIVRPPAARMRAPTPQEVLGLVRQGEAQQEAMKLKRDMYYLKAEAEAGNLPQLDLPVNIASVGANSSGSVTVSSPEPIRIVNFITSSAQADAFNITGIFVGRLNLLLSAGGVPASSYAADARRGPMQSPKIPATVGIQVVVQNLTGAALRFDATLRCRSLLGS